MSEATPSWEDLNEQHVSAGVAWVRLRLERLAAEKPPAARAKRRLVRHQSRGLCAWLWGTREPVVLEEAPPPALTPAPSATEENAAKQQMERIEKLLDDAGRPAVLARICRELSLLESERNVLLLCLAAELNTRVGDLCALVMGDPHRPYPTFALARRLFENFDWQALTPDRPLRGWSLIEIQQPAATPLIQAALRIDERILHLIKGWRSLDDRLLGIISPIGNGRRDGAPRPSQMPAARRILDEWQRADREKQPWPIAHVLGPDPTSKLCVAEYIVGQIKQRLYRLPFEQLPLIAGDLDQIARLWQRESMLHGLALYLDAEDEVGLRGGDGGSAARLSSLNRLLTCYRGVLILASREHTPRLGRPVVVVEVVKPTPREQRLTWASVAPHCDGQFLNRIAAQFNLDDDVIRSIGRSVETDDSDPVPPEERLWDECRRQTRPRLEGLAELIDAKAGWDDLIVPPAQGQQLENLAAQVKDRWQVYDTWGMRELLNRGLGISALFAGDSGTGKTMAAEVIANELRLDLYRIDLSAVVSKYIGETEKNLRKLFDHFDDCGAVLFFDECDALFGKRTEVKDAHDRYANIEVSYLLQRLESYRGLAILATNQRGALDPAFLRRLRFVVTFAPPDQAIRERIWKRMLPANGTSVGVPSDHLNYAWLSRFDLTGGNIQSAALNAAFLAAKRGHEAVTLEDVRDSIQAELMKLNRTLRTADLVLPAVARNDLQPATNGTRR